MFGHLAVFGGLFCLEWFLMLDRLLPQRTFGALRELRNLGDGGLRF
jgi:hypothetical protein